MASNEIYAAWINYSNNKSHSAPNLTLHEFEQEFKTGKKYNIEVNKFCDSQKSVSFDDFDDFDDWDEEDYENEWVN